MKKNRVYVNKINKKSNNQDNCVVEEKVTVEKNISVEDKLNSLFNTNGYIFNIKVKIITDNKIYNTRIATRVGNSIITLDNDVIHLNEIKDIVF